MMAAGVNHTAGNGLRHELVDLRFPLIDHRCLLLGTDNANHRLLSEALQHTGDIVGVPHRMKQIDQGDQRFSRWL
jgi:hypothetical protein